MKNLTFLLPLVNPEYNKLNTLIDSLPEKAMLIVCGKYDKSKVNRNKYILHIAQDTSLTEALNTMVGKVKTEFLSFVSWDDEVTNIYEKRFVDYTNELKDVDIFLPMILERDNLGNPVSYTNNSVWANGFSDKQGFLDFGTLERFMGYTLYGAIIRTEVFKDIGLFKLSLDTIFEYEFLLRATQMGKTVFVIPKLMYVHIGRENSRTQQLRKKFNQIELKEMKFKAKKECYFKVDR